MKSVKCGTSSSTYPLSPVTSFEIGFPSDSILLRDPSFRSAFRGEPTATLREGGGEPRVFNWRFSLELSESQSAQMIAVATAL